MGRGIEVEGSSPGDGDGGKPRFARRPPSSATDHALAAHHRGPGPPAPQHCSTLHPFLQLFSFVRALPSAPWRCLRSEVVAGGGEGSERGCDALSRQISSVTTARGPRQTSLTSLTPQQASSTNTSGFPSSACKANRRWLQGSRQALRAASVSAACIALGRLGRLI